MSVISAAPAAPGGPSPVRWTCAQFHQAGDMGLFEGSRAMLIDGVILEQGPMNPPHAIAVGLVQTVLLTIFAAGWWLRIQLPMVLGLRTDPMPDLAVVPGSPRDYTAHPSTAALVVEVSDTTLHFDTNHKRLLYAEARIPEYWVLDLNARELLVFRDSNATDYSTRLVLGMADVVSPLAAPTATVQVADLLP